MQIPSGATPMRYAMKLRRDAREIELRGGSPEQIKMLREQAEQVEREDRENG
jgi:hypothetical protein